MAGEFGRAFVEVVPDFSSFNRDADKNIRKSLGDAGDAGSKSFGSSFTGGIGRLAAPIAGAIAALGIGRLIGNAIGEGINFARDSIDVASGLQEANTAIEAVFKGGSAAIQDFSKSAAQNLGQSRLEALKAAQTFGVYGQAAGLADAENVKFSSSLVALGGDLASFYDSTPEEAIEALGAGLRGESEPLRRFGILLDDATLRQKALELGIYSGNGSLTQQQRVLAAQAAIMAQSSVAQGDFAKTSDGLANQQRILAASFEDAKAKLGEQLLPGVLAFMTVANDQLIPALGKVIDQVGPILSQALTDTAPQFIELVDAIAPLIPDLVELAVSALPVFVDVLKLIVPLLADWARNTTSVFTFLSLLLDYLNGNITIEEFGRQLLGMDGKLADLLNTVGRAVGGFVGFSIGVGQAMAQVNASIKGKIDEAVAFISGLPGRAVAAVGNLGSLLVGSGKSLVQGFINGIRDMIGAVGNAASAVVQRVRNFFPNSPAKEGPFSGAGWRQLAHSGEAIMDQFRSKMDGSIELGATYRGVDVASSTARLSASTIAERVGVGSGAGSLVSVGTMVAADTDEAVRKLNTQFGRALSVSGLLEGVPA